MTLQTLNTAIRWPGLIEAQVGNPSVTTHATLDAATEYQAYVFCAREAMTISHVGWRTGVVAGAPTADTRIETVAADGTPSGTLWAVNTNIVSGALSSNTWTLHALTASASIVAGQMFVVMIQYVSGTSIIVQNIANLNSGAYNVPYFVTNTSGSAVKSRGGNAMIALGSNTTTFYSLVGNFPASVIANTTFNNTNAAAKGLRFQVPFKCRCVGVRTHLHSSVGDYNAVLYNDAGTELSSSSTAFDGDHSSNQSSAIPNAYFDNPVTLSPGTWYRAALEPSSATNIVMTTIQLPSSDYRSATPFGSNAHWATRASGSWTDTATDTLPVMDILIDQLDDGVAAAAVGHGNMTGGLQ